MFRLTRNPINCTFRSLKARWANLTRKTDLKLEASSTVIYFFFVLNNEKRNDKLYSDKGVVQSQFEIKEHLRS